MVGTCEKCEMCNNQVEQYCPKLVATDGLMGSGEYGACSDIMVANQKFAVLWPENLPMDSGVPLMCGVTAYSPLRRYGLDKPGMSVGVVGIGGLGHLAVRFAKAFGAKVTVISSSAKKKNEALEELGADSFLVTNNPEEMQGAAGTLDGIIDTVPVVHALEPLLALLKPFGKLIALSGTPIRLHLGALLQGGKSIVGSIYGSIKDIQEMLDFAAKHNIVADVEVISCDYINAAMERIETSNVKYRFVIDVGNTLKAA